MATITSISGAPRVQNPITVQVGAASPSGTLSFHRVKVKVIVAGQEIEMSSPVSNGELVSIDVSSALRSVADSYEYSAGAATYPVYQFQVKAWDEYMSGGEVHTTEVSTSATYYALLGGYTDAERMMGQAQTSGTQKMSRKPTTGEVVCVGESYAYTPDKSGSLQSITAPESHVATISQAGAQTINGRTLYAMPADTSGNRYEFRFINGFGVLESFSLYCLRESQMNVASTFHTIARKETLTQFSRGINRKSQDYETWKMSSGPLTEEWMQWFMHEFLMAEHVWIRRSGQWLRCHLIVDEQVGGINRKDTNAYECTFSVRMDVAGMV